MKRARNSTLPETRTEPGPSVTNLPSALVVEILVRLTAKSIVMCKSVCKAWYGLISDPQFANLHLARESSCVLIRDLANSKFSRSFYFMEPGDAPGFDSWYCHCSRARKQSCERCRSDIKVNHKLKTPLRNVRAMLDKAGDDTDSEAMFYLGTNGGEGERLIRMKSRLEHSFKVVNSCNGFICLREPRWPVSLCICNPITGEFTNLPRFCHGSVHERVNSFRTDSFGFGFSPKHNQYKVIRRFLDHKRDPVTGIRGFHAAAAEIHTLGTDSWRSLDISGSDMPAICPPSYLNGALYWTFRVYNQKYGSVASFDLDDEQFHIHSIPSHHPGSSFNVAALGGRLYLCTSYGRAHIQIWLATECSRGASLSWTQQFSYYLDGIKVSFQPNSYRLVWCLNDEAVVLFGGFRQEFIYYNESKGFRLKQPKFNNGVKSDFEVIAFTPSFVSLKDAVSMPGSNIEVLNVNSVCGKLKLLEETYPLLLGKFEK